MIVSGTLGNFASGTFISSGTISVGNKISNSGRMINQEGSLVETNDFSQNRADASVFENYGTLKSTGTFTNAGTITNEGTIESVNGITNSGTITSGADGMKSEIANSGTYNITDGGTVGHNITGNGRMIISGGDVVFEENVVLEQSYLEIGEGSSLAVNVSSISITAQDTAPEIKNNGSLILSTGTVESFASKIAGTGTTTVNLGANVNMGSNSIEQSGLTVDEDSSLTAEIQNLKIQSTDNSGETPTVTPGTITNN